MPTKIFRCRATFLENPVHIITEFLGAHGIESFVGSSAMAYTKYRGLLGITADLDGWFRTPEARGLHKLVMLMDFSDLADATLFTLKFGGEIIEIDQED